MNFIGVALQFEDSEEPDDRDEIDLVEDVGLYLRLNFLYHLEYVP